MALIKDNDYENQRFVYMGKANSFAWSLKMKMTLKFSEYGLSGCDKGHSLGWADAQQKSPEYFYQEKKKAQEILANHTHKFLSTS